nr:MAG TPA: head to tail connecting protein [Caudoviricetes sp.]
MILGITREKLEYYFDNAKKYKEDIRGLYNEVYEYTDVNFSIKDSGTVEKQSKRGVESVILKSQNFLCNFIMSSIFSKSGRWATVKVNQEAFKKLSGVDGEAAEGLSNEINKVLENNSDTVYFTNDNTNYYTETSKALLDCIKVGTGIRKIIELKDNTKCFTYAYQNLDNIYILEDNLGKPNIIFKVYVEKNLNDINDLFGHLPITTPKGLNEDKLEEKINIIECVVGVFDEDTSTYKYYHGLFTEAFEEMLYEGELNYNPYTVFRWKINSSNPWGIGIGLENLDLFKELKDLKEKRKKHADKIVSPPLNFYGSTDLINKVSLKANAKNYGGSGIGGDKYGVEPINIGTNLLPVEKDIEQVKQEIREVFMSQPLGDVSDTKNRSATEMSLRHEMFRKEFSGTYELINTELLEPTFMNAYYIMDGKGLLNTTEDESYINISQIQYINELTRNAGSDEVINTINFYMTLSQVVPETQRQFIFKIDELIDWASKKMRVPLDVLNSKEEIKQLIAQQQQLEQMQQMAMIQEGIGKRQDVGIGDEIKEGMGVFNGA